jgi:hypothetical protein
LLKTEPRVLVLGQFHDLGSVVTVVGPVGGTIVVVAFSKNKDVVTTAEGILEDGGGTKVYIGVMTRSLVGRRAIKVPGSELTYVCHLLGDGLEEKDRHKRGRERQNRETNGCL